MTRLQPAGLPTNPAFANGVSVDGGARTIYVGGQNGVEPDGSVARDNAQAQTRQALRNVELVLAEAGAALTDVVYWRIALVRGAALPMAFAASHEVWGDRGAPPALTVDVVVALANPAFLVEITATAALAL